MSRRDTLLAERRTAVTDALALSKAVTGRDFTEGEVADALALKGRVERIDRELAELGADEDATARRKADDTAMRKAIADLGAGIGLVDGDTDPANGQRSTRVKAGHWAAHVADRMTKAASHTGVKALTTGSITVANPLLPDVVAFPEQPRRITDLLLDREGISGVNYTFLQQIARENNAAPVPDHGTKPTSIFTAREVAGRAKVIAHLAEPFPERWLSDYATLTRWLEAELEQGVVAAVEDQVVNGTGEGEDFTGLLHTSGTLAVPFSTNMLVTLRKARTAMELVSEVPNAWALNPSDLEAIDLLREDGEQGGFLVGGSSAAGTNVFGDLPRVASPLVPAGTALLGDWAQARLIVREEVRIDADRSGELFKKNEVQLRAEGRFDLAVIRPRAFAVVALAA